MSRSIRLAVIVATLLALSHAPVASAAQPQCDGISNGNLFAGMGKSAAVNGVIGTIEWFDTHLCVQRPSAENSWSLSWVSIDGFDDPNQNGFDIFQIGFAKCPPPSVGSCPWNGGVSYHWYFYEHEAGICGQAANTGFQNVGNAGTGYWTYRIQKQFAGGDWWYVASINGASKVSLISTDLDTCFGSLVQAEWKNEMLDPGDQNGGTVSNHQNFSDNQYHDSSGWHAMNWALNRQCDANSNQGSWKCTTSPSTLNLFYNWDVREP